MTKIEIVLSEDDREFIGSRIQERGFSSVSEYIAELIRSDRDRSAREHLKELLLEGLNSGDPIEATDEWWEKKKAELTSRLTETGR